MESSSKRALEILLHGSILGLLHKKDYEMDDDSSYVMNGFLGAAHVLGMSHDEIRESLATLTKSLNERGKKVELILVDE